MKEKLYLLGAVSVLVGLLALIVHGNLRATDHRIALMTAHKQTIPTTEGIVIEPAYELHIATDDRRNAIELALGFAARLRWDELEDEKESEATE